MRKLLVATHNQGKIREYAELLADLPLTVVSLADAGISRDVEETGATFEENARLKAETYAAWSGLWTWADDSGLEVDALDGRPGVYSARYAGVGASDRDRYLKLLDELEELQPENRGARFRCVVALTIPGGATHTVEAEVPGLITDQPRGSYGFGYDPIFYLPDHGATMAELPPQVKNRISHRGQAAAKAREVLLQLLED